MTLLPALRGAEEASERPPLVERVADGFAQGALGQVLRLLRLEPGVERFHRSAAPVAPEHEVLGRAEDVHLGRELLDLVHLEDEVERVFRLRSALERVEQVPTKVGDAADALPALGYRHLVVAGVAVGDEEALGPAQDGHRGLAGPARAVTVGDEVLARLVLR